MAPRPPRPVTVAREAAAELPVARIAVDISLPHLDRVFDYLVPADDDLAAQPGVRVKVRFSGRLVDGFILERAEESEHGGRLALLHRVVSDEVVLTEPIARLARAVADRYAGTMADVLRLAVPPRHGRTENETPPADPNPTTAAAVTNTAAWEGYRAGPALVAALTEGRAARAVWSALPGEDWPARLAELAQVTWAAGRGVLLLVPDARDLARVEAALAAVLATDEFVALSADLGPAARYRRFLAVSRGRVRVVVGTRAAVFAPVRKLGLIAIFDDGDDLFAEPRAPYPHIREVAMMRSAAETAALVVGAYARSAEAALLVDSGWAREVIGSREEIRRRAPRIEAAGDDWATGSDSAAARARLSPAAFAAARAALAEQRPVLIQVPRAGYLPALTCVSCRRPARCRRCSGPLAIPAGARTPTCRWCAAAVPRWACPACGGTRLRATVTGAARTAEEIGRAFPGARLITSAGGSVIDRIDDGPAIVVATPGAEPLGRYGAALLLDGGLMLSRPDLRAGEEALRRWLNAAALVRSAADGGRVIIGADMGSPAAQAVIRWDVAGFGAQELADRRELGFPPAVAMASITGSEAAVADSLDQIDLPGSALVLGPVPAPRRRDGQEQVRALLRVPQQERRLLTGALTVLAATRSTRKDSEIIRIEVDPAVL